MTIPPPAVQLRAHAQANRERLLAAAREALAVDPAASLNSIAKSAAVGPATLYRHFPTREALIVAVYRAALEGLVDVAGDMLQRMSPIEALRSWCHHVVAMARSQRGFTEMLTAATSESDRMEAHRPVLMAISKLLVACEQVNSISIPVEPVDVQFLLSFMWQIRTSEGERRARRLVDIIIRGLTAPADDPEGDRPAT